MVIDHTWGQVQSGKNQTQKLKTNKLNFEWKINYEASKHWYGLFPG